MNSWDQTRQRERQAEYYKAYISQMRDIMERKGEPAEHQPKVNSP